jgi:hypothetical protein
MAKTKWQMISSNSFQNSSSAKLQCRITCFLPEKKKPPRIFREKTHKNSQQQYG